MKNFKIKNDYKNFVKGLLSLNYLVIAPKYENGILKFSKIKNAAEILSPSEYINTVSSTKEYFFPQTEPVIKFTFEGKEIFLKDVEIEKKPKVVLGLRPCDAASFSILDDIFQYEYKDEFYFTRRENTIIIGAACESNDESCFCTTTGLAPDSSQGADLFIEKNNEEKYFLRAVTEKGERLVEQLIAEVEELEEEPKKNPLYEKIEKQIRKKIDLIEAKKWLDNNFENEKWEELSSQCLSCGSCAYLCPTCHCFDIVDEVNYNSGVRRKNWDACQFDLFTLHSSGHNPRDTKAKRYRQRVMHKFKYYADRFDKTLCTGCGRCIRACPVNIDIYEVVKEFAPLVEQN